MQEEYEEEMERVVSCLFIYIPVISSFLYYILYICNGKIFVVFKRCESQCFAKEINLTVIF